MKRTGFEIPAVFLATLTLRSPEEKFRRSRSATPRSRILQRTLERLQVMLRRGLEAPKLRLLEGQLGGIVVAGEHQRFTLYEVDLGLVALAALVKLEGLVGCSD